METEAKVVTLLKMILSITKQIISNKNSKRLHVRFFLRKTNRYLQKCKNAKIPTTATTKTRLKSYIRNVDLQDLFISLKKSDN